MTESGPLRNLRKILPHVWRRRWLLCLIFALMCVYAGSLQLRNLVPGVFLDGVLLPGLGGTKSIMPTTFKRILRPLGIDMDTRPQAMTMRGAFSGLVLENYETFEDRPDEDELVFLNGVASFTVVVNDEHSPRTTLPFTRLTVASGRAALERDNDGRITSITGGPSLDLEWSPPANLTGMSYMLRALVILGIVVCVVLFTSRFFFKLLEQHVLQNVLADLRRDVIGHMSGLSLDFYDSRSRGDLLSRISHDLNKLNTTLQMIFGDLLLQPIILVSAAGACIYICWWLAAVVILAYPLLFLLMARAGRKVRQRSHKQSTKRGLMSIAVEQLFSGIRTVKSFNMEKFELAHFQERNRSVVKQALRTARAKILANASVELVSHVGVIAVLGIAGFFLVRGQLGLTGGELIAFLTFVQSMYHPTKALARAYTSFQESMGAMDRVMEIFECRPAIVEIGDAATMPPFQSSIRFDAVSFSYGREPVLHDIDLEIKAGTFTAIVGPTGAGKSTITDLILRFYDPTEGRILIDGRDIRSLTISSLTSQISIVSQDPFLFDASIGRNIRYGKPDATTAEIETAARMANIHEFIDSLKEGYDTTIGDRGVMLSGGQRQRVTIARALLKNAPILILDEATSSLDSESEAAVQAALENLIRVPSTIAIAHRLSTIRRANRIIVLDQGRIAETGTYDDLLENRGLFWRLHATQSGNGDGAT